MSTKKKAQAINKPNRLSSSFIPRMLLNDNTALVLSAAYVIILGWISFTYHKIGDYGVETDFYWTYAPHAKQILQGHIEVDPFKGPGYEIVLAAVGALTGDFFRGGMLLSLISAGVILFVTTKLIAKLFNPETALLVCIALATNFTFLINSYSSATDMFFNLLTASVLFFLLHRDDLHLPDMAYAGAMTGFAYVTRYNAVAFYLAVIVGLLFLNYKNVEWKKRVIATGVFIASSLVFVIPWGLYCLANKGTFFFNNNHLNIAYEMFGKGRMGWDEYWYSLSGKFHSYFDVMAYSPGTFFKQIAFNAWDHFWKDVSLLVGIPLGIFAFGGIIALVAQKINRQQVMFFLFSAAFYFVLIPVFYGERFSLYLAPTIILLSICFFQWRKVPSVGFSQFGLKQIVLLGAIVFTAYSSFMQISATIGSGPVEILQVRDSFFGNPANSSNQKAIVARKPQIAYYLDMKFIPFPYVGTIEELVAESKKAGAHYLYYSGIEAGMRPQFQYLLNSRNAPKGFKPIVQIYNPPAVLYELTLE